MTIKQHGGVFGRNPKFNSVETDSLTIAGNAVPDASTLLVDGDIGTSVQGYDADTAKLDVAQTFTAAQTFNENIVMANTKGIDFSATGDGSGTTTSELFDDYEEGTFTAARTGFTEVLGGGTITSTGTYTKAGRLVTVNITLECTGGATIAGSSGGVSYFNLPFTSAYDAAGVWANRTLVNANGGVLVNLVQMYMTTAWGASSNTRVFSATYSV
jgi:hypothetical protein